MQTSLTRIGRRVGVLLVANVAGSMLGTVLTGWLLLDKVGTAGTMKLLAILAGMFGVLVVVLALRASSSSWVWSRRMPAAPAALLATSVVFVPLLSVMPPSGMLWAHLHGTVVEAMLYAEDGSGLSVVNTDGKNAILYANGIGQGALPYGEVHTALGALPAFMHPAPRTAAVIGLGSGDTVHTVAGRRDIQRVTCVESSAESSPRSPACGCGCRTEGCPTCWTIRASSRCSGTAAFTCVAAARTTSSRRTPCGPAAHISGTLYSDAYFALLRAHLAQNGLAATWAPTQRVYNTFIRAFPHVVAMPGILVGSNQPIAIDRAAISARLAEPAAREHFARAGIDLERLLADYLANPTVYGPDYPRDSLTDIDTDLFPKDEFDLSPR